jgi:hypothetical protein
MLLFCITFFYKPFTRFAIARMAKPITASQKDMSGRMPGIVLVYPNTAITTIITEIHQVITFGALGFIILLHFKIGYGNEALRINGDFGLRPKFAGYKVIPIIIRLKNISSNFYYTTTFSKHHHSRVHPLSTQSND